MSTPRAAAPFYASSLDCVHCGLCLEACPTYRVLGLETDSPRGRLYLMRALAEGRIEDPEAIRPHLDRCLDCRACESVCPSGVRYGEILEAARSELEKARPRRGFKARVRRFLLWHLVARQRRLRLAFTLARAVERLGLRRAARAVGLLRPDQDVLLPPVPPAQERRSLAGVHRAVGQERGEVYVFTGCVMEQMFGRINRATIELLTKNGFTVHVPAEQTCCGALLVHDGQADRARRLAAANVQAFSRRLPIVLNSAGCGCAMREYGHLLQSDAAREFAGRVRDVSEFLAEVGLAATPAPRPRRLTFDDPCHLCHGQGVRQPPRTLLRQVPGIELISHEDPEDCCGSAGIYNLLQPALAQEIGRRKAASILASGAEQVVTANPGCMLQLRAVLQASEPPVEVVHLVEVLLPPPSAP
ncbi:MAG: (Fe-S)-binding protein [Planctomycetota bacterium]